MSPNQLAAGGLYILLFIRGDPPARNDFHWALYLHADDENGGTKYHIKNQGAGWIADHGVTNGVLKSFLLVGLFQIALVPPRLHTYVDNKVKKYDGCANDIPGVTCRVWLLKVLEDFLVPVDGITILKCDDLGGLQAETMEFGNKHSASAAENFQPRPLGYSRYLPR